MTSWSEEFEMMKHFMKLWMAGFIALLLVLTQMAVAPGARAASYIVFSLADSGAGSLREAITSANSNAGADTITFSVSGAINLASALPNLTDASGVTIDGGGNIVIDGGSSVGIGLNSASSQNNVIKNLTLQNFTTAGIQFLTYTGGTDGGHVVDNVTVDNSVIGILIYNGSGVTVQNSTLTNNSSYGVAVEWFSGVPNVTITGNTIGSSGNSNGSGVWVANEGADGVTISSNDIAYNATYGIEISGGADNASIQGNTLSHNGDAQSEYGIYITGEGTDGAQITASNVIEYSSDHGIAVVSGPNNTVIQGNELRYNGQTIVGVYAGSGIMVYNDSTNSTSTVGTVIGGAGSGQANNIHHNVGNGITVQGDSSVGPADTSIIGNSIHDNSQTSIDGVGIQITGIVEDGSDADSYTVVIQQNVINNNHSQGILVENGGAGSPTNTLIGGTYSTEGNLIYGNGQEGVLIRDSGTNDHLVKGNTIGVSAAGGTSAAASPNANSGIAITNGAQNNTIEDNDIAYNAYQDVLLSGSGTTGNVVRNNTIDSDSNETPHNYDNSGVVITSGASSNTIGQCNSITEHLYEGILILGDNADSNVVSDNNSDAGTCASSTPAGDTPRIYDNGRGISVINNSVPGETFGRVDSNHATPGPDSTTIQNNAIESNVGDGVYIKLTSNTQILDNSILNNSDNGVLWVGSTGGSVQGNAVTGNSGHGLRVEPHYGSSTSPDTASDDHLNGTLLVGASNANAFSNNGGSGVYIIDDDIGYTASQIASANTFSGNTDNEVQQDWLGVVEILQESGGSWTTITSGQTVTITAQSGSPTWSGSAYDATTADSSRGVWGPSGLDYDDVDTWFHVTQEVVDNSGALHTYTAHTASTSGALTHPGKAFSYDGDSATDPVSPDHNLPFSNDTASSAVGRYQIAELDFSPTAVGPTSFAAHSQTPAGGMWAAMFAGMVTIGLAVTFKIRSWIA